MIGKVGLLQKKKSIKQQAKKDTKLGNFLNHCTLLSTFVVEIRQLEIISEYLFVHLLY